MKGHGLEGYLTGKRASPPEFVEITEEGEGIVNPDFLTWNNQEQLLAS